MSGSPPPMRGKVQLFPQVPQWTGITPAYAGKSFRKTAVRHAIKDHPRLCGEKPVTLEKIPLIPGSPPPMRGKASSFLSLLSLFRITPAYAGKREFKNAAAGMDEDHPRLCGEKWQIFCVYNLIGGSPPPMRGKVQLGLMQIPCVRITPAYAGKRILR